MQDFVFFEYNDGMRYRIYDIFPTIFSSLKPSHTLRLEPNT